MLYGRECGVNRPRSFPARLNDSPQSDTASPGL